MGKLTAIHMQSQGIGRLIITSRTAAHASALAQSIGGSAMPWEALNTTLVEADILITATGASTPIISRALIAQTMKARRQKPLFIIDIAVPRDVEGDAGDLEQVFLYNIDDLQAVVQENISKRGTEASDAEKIIAQEVGRFTAWLNSRGAVPTIVALRQRFESIRQSELRRLEPKMAWLPPEARARVDEITRLIMEKLLINPTEQLKSASDADTVATYSDALTRLFGLAGDEPLTTRSPPPARAQRRNPHSETLRLGSRGSQLALFQARLVAERIHAAGGPRCEIVVIKTSGDQLQEAPLSDIGGKRLFVKEIEDALLSGDIDLAVHSSKDMPAMLPDGLDVAAVLEREDPRDALVLPHGPEPRAQSPEPPRDRNRQRAPDRAIAAAISHSGVSERAWERRHAAPQARLRRL